jgi:chitinase
VPWPPASSNAVTATDDTVGSGKHGEVGHFVDFVKNLETSGAANLTCRQGVTRATSTNPQDPDQGTGAGDADYARPFPAAQSVDGVADTGFENLRGNVSSTLLGSIGL